MIATWRRTPFGVVVALSGRDPIVVELRGDEASTWVDHCETGGPDVTLIQRLLSDADGAGR